MSYWKDNIQPLLEAERTNGLSREYMDAYSAAWLQREGTGGFAQKARHAIFYACQFSFDSKAVRNGKTRAAMDSKRIY